MKSNYHIHTKLCKHAYGEDEEYVISAIKGGYSRLGFADHTLWLYSDRYNSNMRMEVNQLSIWRNRTSSLYIKRS